MLKTAVGLGSFDEETDGRSEKGGDTGIDLISLEMYVLFCKEGTGNIISFFSPAPRIEPTPRDLSSPASMIDPTPRDLSSPAPRIEPTPRDLSCPASMIDPTS